MQEPTGYVTLNHDAYAPYARGMLRAEAIADSLEDRPRPTPPVPGAARNRITVPGATADFNGDGTPDLLCQAASGNRYLLDGATGVQTPLGQPAADPGFLAAVELNGDGGADARHRAGQFNLKRRRCRWR